MSRNFHTRMTSIEERKNNRVIDLLIAHDAENASARMAAVLTIY